MLAANLIINKLLQTKDFSIIKKNGLESYYFDGYEDEFNFIVEHYKKYGNIPDEMPFAEKFPDFEPFVVNETDDYLIDKLHEEYGYKKFTQMLPVLNEKLKDDSRVAYEYLRQEMANLKPRTVCNGIDIIENFAERFDEYLNKRQSGIATCISTGFAEFDGAVADYNKAIIYNKNLKLAYWERAQILFEQRKYSVAFNDYVKYSTFDKNDAGAQYNAGICLYNIGKKQAALPYLNKAKSLAQSSGNTELYNKSINVINEIKGYGRRY